MNSVGICILNYNNGQRTISAIQSALAQTHSNSYIIVVDNASIDDSAKDIKTFIENVTEDYIFLQESDMKFDPRADLSKITLIVAKDNGGYSSGNNLAINFAKSSSILSHILIINNDVILNYDFVEVMLRCYNNLSSAYGTLKIALGSYEYNGSGTRIHEGFHYLHLLSGLSFNLPVPPYFRYIVGSCILLPVGTPLMDTSYFLYYDDAQFSKILLKEGYLIGTCSESYFSHEGNATTKNIKDMYVVIFKSMKHFYKLNYPYLYPVVIIVRFFLDLIRGNWTKSSELIKSAFRPLTLRN